MKIHLAWFGTAGPSSWKASSNSLYDWRKADIYLDIARLCERAKFDMILFADTLSISTMFKGSPAPFIERGTKICHDPVPTLAMMAAVTERIGLATTISTTFYPPFSLARMLGTLDHLTSGRIGWNVVTSANRQAAQNYGLEDLPEHDERYDMADEYLALCRKLWDSWEPDSLIMDRENGRFADASKVHAVNHVGKYYRSVGPLNVVSSPQRYPVTIMAGASPRGQKFAIDNAVMLIVHKNSMEEMKKYSRSIREQLKNAGRDPKSCKIFCSIKPIFGDTQELAKERWEQNQANSDIEIGLAQLSTTMGHDMSQFDLDKPIPADLQTGAIRGKLTQYRVSEKALTLREMALHESMHETFPIYGTPEHIADVIEETAREADIDGFHFRGLVQDYEYLFEIATKLVPVLQRRGLVRTEYEGTTLRDHLSQT